MTVPSELVTWAVGSAARLRAAPSLEERQGPGWLVRVVHRTGRQQVEHVILAPAAVVLPHRHPQIDTVEHYLCGSGVLVLDGHRFRLGPHLSQQRRSVAISHEQWHGGRVGPEGIEFLSIQQWRSEPVSSTAEDWDGPAERVRP